MIQCLICKTLEVSQKREVELRRGKWLVLLSAWMGSTWVPERAGRSGKARGEVAWSLEGQRRGKRGEGVWRGG